MLSEICILGSNLFQSMTVKEKCIFEIVMLDTDNSEAVDRRRSSKQVVLKISHISEVSTCVGVSF